MFKQEIGELSTSVRTALERLGVPAPETIEWVPSPFHGEWAVGTAACFQAAAAEARRSAALKQFDQVLSDLVPRTTLSTDETHLGQLAPTAGRFGGGAVLQLVSPTRLDFVIVLVNGLDPRDVAAIPYRVTLQNAADETLRIGRIQALDQAGGADVYRQFEDRDLTGFTTVKVRDASGDVVLSGAVDQGA